MQYPSGGLPENLTARQYYELGLQYRLAGWVGVAREALERAVELDGESSLSVKASKVLRTQLPRVRVPEQAEQRNIEGFNLMYSDPEQARDVFRELMQTYPDFEWPFSNTARLKLQEGDVSGARGLVKYLLSVNPDLLSAIDLQIKVSLLQEDYDEALEYVNRALAHYPHEDEFKQLKLAIKMKVHGEPPDVMPESLSADDYYELGQEYQAVGRLEDARSAFERAIELAGDDELKKKVRSYIRTQLPRRPVSTEAQRRCVDAIENLSDDPESARQDLTQLTQEYPEFEWPYLFLSSLYMMEGDVEKAEDLILRVIAFNPDLIKAKHLLVNVYMAGGRFIEALEFINESLNLAESEDDGLALDLLKAQCQLHKSLS